MVIQEFVSKHYFHRRADLSLPPTFTRKLARTRTVVCNLIQSIFPQRSSDAKKERSSARSFDSTSVERLGKQLKASASLLLVFASQNEEAPRVRLPCFGFSFSLCRRKFTVSAEAPGIPNDVLSSYRGSGRTISVLTLNSAKCKTA
ncbi:hypothetical protein TNCV_4768651 [Trichonephila clavipes]|nr:hypothetical protein TNCV_4768651 [Trichonephila clavipes]